MNIDDRSDALRVAKQLTAAYQEAIAEAQLKGKDQQAIKKLIQKSTKLHQQAIANALLEANMEGIDQARSLFYQKKAPSEIYKELNGRRAFLERQLPPE